MAKGSRSKEMPELKRTGGTFPFAFSLFSSKKLADPFESPLVPCWWKEALRRLISLQKNISAVGDRRQQADPGV